MQPNFKFLTTSVFLTWVRLCASYASTVIFDCNFAWN